MTGDDMKARLAYLDAEAARLADVMRANRERLGLTVKQAGEEAACPKTCRRLESAIWGGAGGAAGPRIKTLLGFAEIGYDFSSLFPLRTPEPAERPVDVALLITRERARLGLTKEQVAEAAGRAVAWVDRIEGGGPFDPEYTVLLDLWRIGFEVGRVFPDPATRDSPDRSHRKPKPVRNPDAEAATILGVVEDAFGGLWDVREWLDTPHGWRIAVGWPHGVPRGGRTRNGAGMKQPVLTRELVDHLNAIQHRWSPIADANLPLSVNQIKRLRRLLGHARHVDRGVWWRERIDDLRTMTSKEFAAKHEVTVAAVDEAYRRYTVGETRKADAWWREPEAAEILASDLPVITMADRLGRSIKAVWTARYLLGVTNPHHSASKAETEFLALQATLAERMTPDE